MPPFAYAHYKCKFIIALTNDTVDTYYNLKYCRINKKREKSTLNAPFHVSFSRTFRYADRKSCSIFDKSFNLMFLLFFSVVKWNFGIFLFCFFQRGSITVGRKT